MQLGKQVNNTQVEHSRIGFRLNPSSGVPSYAQLVLQVEQALRLGYLNVGDRLPRIKEVVESLAINPNTVLKAYRELETRGIAAGKPGVGTFIVSAPPTLSAELFDQLRREFVDGWLRSARTAGLGDTDIVTLIQSTLDSLNDFPTVLPVGNL